MEPNKIFFQEVLKVVKTPSKSGFIEDRVQIYIEFEAAGFEKHLFSIRNSDKIIRL